MPYSLKLHEERVVAVLRAFPGLSRELRIRVFTVLHTDLKQHADLYRADPARRINDHLFSFDILIQDDTNDVIRRFWFVVNDESAAYGVLKVEYVEIE